ncbi:hypothetical protein ABGB16_19050 [Micromonospora sp. B11E3]|uniref:MGH1-like glycoside hydrolase domain-containing protein n=1 Tax=Micromonospora sp. B11E3 TaxID=3153562 RepID=UPI00325EEE1C
MMWGLGGGGDDIFKGWDSAWDGITALSLDPALALDHIRDFYDQGGPRYDQLHAGPMHAYLAWRAYTRTGDRSILDLVYPVMVPYIDRTKEFDTDGDGLLETPWAGARIGGRGNHLGLDDSPQYWNAIQVPTDGSDNRDNTNLTDVALNSYYGLLADTLSEMAGALGKDADRAGWPPRTVPRPWSVTTCSTPTSSGVSTPSRAWPATTRRTATPERPTRRRRPTATSRSTTRRTRARSGRARCGRR